MTAKLDGTNGLLQQYDYQTPTTGFSYTFAAGTTVLVMNPAGTLATGTITMPASPADGMTITVESTQQVTALTMSGNGGTVVGPAIQLIPNQPLSWVYRLTNTSWYPLFGGAGRASALVSGTSVASTSGTSITFSSLPTWVKRVTLMFNGVSVSGTSIPQIQIGSGSALATGYVGNTWLGNTNNSSHSTGFLLSGQGLGTYTYYGHAILTNLTGNSWVFSVAGGATTAAASVVGGGSNTTLGGALDRVIITTVNGTDTFDAGSINILYE